VTDLPFPKTRMKDVSSLPDLLSSPPCYIIADKYDVPSLKELAKSKYKTALAAEWNNPSFATSLRLMYEGTAESDRALKHIAICAASSHLKELRDRGEFGTLCKENGELDLTCSSYPMLNSQLGLLKLPWNL